MKDLGGKTAFVTGAGSGIGLGIATALAQAGVKVMLCDIEEAALAKAVEGLKRTNADVDGVEADVSLKAELKAAADAAIARYGKVHILVNNAWRAVRRVDRRGMGLDTPCQFDGRHLGNRDFRPLNRAAWRGRAHCVHCVDRRAHLIGERRSIQRIQIRCCRSF
jgi:NAD(P)-dependent dehydrogenase (short-subunit alcohol dehydrogenase family)